MDVGVNYTIRNGIGRGAELKAIRKGGCIDSGLGGVREPMCGFPKTMVMGTFIQR
jgi:hypothetical protein